MSATDARRTDGARHAWLLQAGARTRPEVEVPGQFTLSPYLPEAWRQVLALFRVDDATLASAVAAAAGLTVGDPKALDRAAAVEVSEGECRRFQVLPLRFDEGAAVYGISDPTAIAEAEAALRFATGRRAKFQIIPPDDIDSYLTNLYAADSDARDAGIAAIDLGAADESSAKNVATVRLAKALLRDAIKRRASDVHIQPFAGGGAIRFRVDGRLVRVGTIPAETLQSLARYFLVNAKADPSKFMEAQDGRFRLVWRNAEYDTRLSFLPGHGGMRIVARLLNQRQNFSIARRGFSPGDQQALQRMCAYASGIVLLTGPTGSGKTSTLYSLLSELNRVDVNIMTVENPVEYVLPGISQTNIDPRRGLTFADSLRAILRQDPDIILIGEIRDAETANIAAQAALTGHQVFSTLHANDALSAIPRLLNLGLDAPTLADSLVGIVSQRLVRSLCEACARPVKGTLTPLETQFAAICGEKPARHAIGCEVCGYSGYVGCTPVIERLEMTSALREKLLQGVRDLRELKKAAGDSHRGMAANTAELLVSGRTTVDEVHEVLGMRFWHELAELHEYPVAQLQVLGSADSAGGGRLGLLLLSRDEALSHGLAEETGYPVQRVESIVDARAALQERSGVFAVVADARMQQSELLQWLQKLRAELAWAGLPVIFVSDRGATELNDVLQRNGARVVPGFPVDVQELAEAVRTASS